MSDVALGTVAALVAVAAVAGAVDAIAGGGGLVTVPALLLALPSPAIALATNKGQSVFGSATSLASYARAGRVDRARVLPALAGGFLGAILGVRLLLLVRPDALRPIVLALLVASAVFFAARRPHKVIARAPSPPRPWLAFAITLALGAYDGFFGPGTGTFLIVGFVALCGRSMVHASADAKVVNFAANLAALLLFAQRGLVVWVVALPMAVGQLLGGVIGANLAMKGGARVVRIVVLVVSGSLIVKLAVDLLAARS